MTVSVKDHHPVKGGKAVGGFQCAVIAVARHRVGPQLGVQRQSQFQIPQAVAQKDQGIDAFGSLSSACARWRHVRCGCRSKPEALSQKGSSSITIYLDAVIHQPAGPVAKPAAACTLRSWNRACPAPPPWRRQWGQSPVRSAPAPAGRPAPASVPASGSAVSGAPAITSTYSPRGSLAA